MWDICDTGNEHPYSDGFLSILEGVTGYDLSHGEQDRDRKNGLQDSIVELRKSYRFGPESGIKALSRAINSGDHDLAWSILSSNTHSDIAWRELPATDALPNAVNEIVTSSAAWDLQVKDPKEALGRFEGYCILSGLREGPFGVVALNRIVEGVLKQKGRIKAPGTVVCGPAHHGHSERLRLAGVQR